jgi:hypothetical protein
MRRPSRRTVAAALVAGLTGPPLLAAVTSAIVLGPMIGKPVPSGQYTDLGNGLRIFGVLQHPSGVTYGELRVVNSIGGGWVEHSRDWRVSGLTQPERSWMYANGGPLAEHEWRSVFRAGWPLQSFYGGVSGTGDGSAGNPMINAESFRCVMAGDVVIPYGIRMGPSLANFTLWTACTLVTLMSGSAAKHAIANRHSTCVRCRYPAHSLRRCPECGTEVE